MGSYNKFILGKVNDVDEHVEDNIPNPNKRRKL